MLDLNVREYRASVKDTEWFYFDKPIVYINYWYRDGADNGGLSNVYARVNYIDKTCSIPIRIPVAHIFRRNEWIMHNRESKIKELINHTN